MPLSFFNKDKEDSFIVFDVGNASLGGALVEKRGDNLLVISSARTPLVLGERIKFERLSRSVMSEVESISQILKLKTPKSLNKIYVILASPWYSAETKILSIKKEVPFVLTREIQDEAIKKEIIAMKRLLSEKKSTAGKSFIPLERDIIHVVMNGYETPDPLGKSAKEVKMALYLSLGNQAIMDGIAEKIKSVFPKASIIPRTFPLAYYSAIRDSFPHKKDYLLFDISGELTDVALVRQGVLREIRTFPLGRNFIMRRISTAMKKNAGEAESAFLLRKTNSLSKANIESLDKIIGKAKTEWLKELEEVLADLSGDLYVPGEVFLAADEDVEDLFSGWISSEGFSQYSLSHDKFKIFPLSMEKNLNIEYAKDVSRDQFLSIATLFAQKLIEAHGGTS